MKVLICYIVLSLVSISSYANQSNLDFKIHNTKIIIKTPYGFYDSSDINPDRMITFSKSMPKGLTTQGVLVPKNDISKKYRYMALVTNDKIDKLTLSQKSFEIIKKGARKKQFSLSRDKERIDKMFSDWSEFMSEFNNHKLEISPNEITPLRIFLDNDEVLGFSSINHLNIFLDDNYSDRAMVSATSLVKVKNKLVNIYVYSKYESIKDIIWVESKAKEFAYLLLDSNKKFEKHQFKGWKIQKYPDKSKKTEREVENERYALQHQLKSKKKKKTVVFPHVLGLIYSDDDGLMLRMPCETAFNEWRSLAEQGDANAQNCIGLMYEWGDEGVRTNYNEAFKWFSKAANQGHAEAQFNLGLLYKSGRGVLKDEKKAVKWYRKSAEQGNVHGQSALGYSYKHGRGVLKDYKKAIKWNSKAAEQGHGASQFGLAVLFGHGDDVPQDLPKAKYWAKKAYENPDLDPVKEYIESLWNNLELWKY